MRCLIAFFVCVISISSVFAHTDSWLNTDKEIIIFFDDNVCEISNSTKIMENTYIHKKGDFINCINHVFTSPVWEMDGIEFSISNQILLYDVADIKKVNEILKSHIIIDTISHQTNFGIFYDVKINCPSYKEILDICDIIKNVGVCKFVAPDYITFDKISDSTYLNNPYYIDQWGLNNNLYPQIDINAPEVWKYAIGTGIKIAVNDDGVDLNHYDLVDNLLSGYDFTDGAKDGLNGGYGQFNDSTCVDNHGTLCSEIIGAVNNSIDIIGVAYNAKLLPARIMYSIDPTNPTVHVGSTTWKRNAFLTEITLGIDVTSNSWVTAKSSTIDTVFYYAVTYGRNGKGCVNVCASGNEYKSSISYPASSPYTIAVGAINKYGFRAPFSNYGSGLDVVAPGVSIYTTDVNNQHDDNQNGTSMACPFVAGVAALMLSVNPDLTWQEVRSIIRQTAYKLPAYTFDVVTPDGMWNNEVGYGLVDANAAVLRAGTKYIQNKTYQPQANTQIRDINIYVGYSVDASKPLGNVVIAPHARVIYQGTNEIVLEHGFTANEGSYFVAEIVDVYNNPMSLPLIDIGYINNENIQELKVDCVQETLSKPSNGLYVQYRHFSDNIILQSATDIESISIYTITGQCALQTNQTEIDVSALSHGIYIITATTTNGNILQSKFIHQ